MTGQSESLWKPEVKSGAPEDKHFLLRMQTILVTKQANSHQPPFVITLNCNPRIFITRTILDKHCHTTEYNQELKHIFDKLPTMTYRRNTNIRDMIVGASLHKTSELQHNNEIVDHEHIDEASEWKGVYVQATQKGYI